MQIILGILISLLFLYVLFLVVLYIKQNSFIFEPDKLQSDYTFEFDTSFEEFFVEAYDGEKLNCLWFKGETLSTKGCVLYHHGNAYNLKLWASFYKDFVDAGYDVLFYDYRGYGKSSGKVKPNYLKKDAYSVYRFLQEQYPANKIIQFGRSLGTGFAVYLAYRVRAPLLILETPYYSLLSLAMEKIKLAPVKWIIKFPMRSDAYLIRLTCPVYIFHGTKDVKIPFIHSLRLSQLNDRVHVFKIKEGTHMDLNTFEKYHLELRKILDEFVKN